MRKTIYLILLTVSILAIILRVGTKTITSYLGIKQKAGLRIETNQKAKVLLNNKEVGNTPFQDEDLSEGEYLVEVKSEVSTSSANFWKGYAKLNSGTLTVINRDLADKPTSSSGETITLEKGSGVTVISNPGQASVTIDGKSIGRTPVSYSNVSSGEHQIIVSKDNFLKRSIRATVIEGYNLTINVDLAITEPDLTTTTAVPTTQTQTLVILNTPTGFLRVRSAPNTTSSEVGRVSPGDNVILLEEIPNWDRIRLSDGKEGYVSSSYTQKKSGP